MLNTYKPIAIRRERELTDEELYSAAPSIFAQEAHQSRSARYAYIPTAKVLQGLRSEGFLPFAAMQTICRDMNKTPYTKHMVRLRQAGEARQGGQANEIVLINSHDGTSSYRLIAGVFRFVCMNGLIVGNKFDEACVMHSGKIQEQVIEAAYSIVDQFKAVDASREAMENVRLSRPEQLAFANAALLTKWPDPEAPAPVEAFKLIEARRHADTDDSLWVTYNRVQENILRGGIEGQGKNRRRVHTRPVKSIQQNVAINRALWTLAEAMRDLKQAA